GHTRLPRYARGKTGVIIRDHGVFLFPDTNAAFLGEKPQHVYSVRFTARELLGNGASPRGSVHLGMWGDYLEGACAQIAGSTPRKLTGHTARRGWTGFRRTMAGPGIRAGRQALGGRSLYLEGMGRDPGP